MSLHEQELLQQQSSIVSMKIEHKHKVDTTWDVSQISQQQFPSQQNMFPARKLTYNDNCNPKVRIPTDDSTLMLDQMQQEQQVGRMNTPIRTKLVTSHIKARPKQFDEILQNTQISPIKKKKRTKPTEIEQYLPLKIERKESDISPKRRKNSEKHSYNRKYSEQTEKPTLRRKISCNVEPTSPISPIKLRSGIRYTPSPILKRNGSITDSPVKKSVRFADPKTRRKISNLQ